MAILQQNCDLNDPRQMAAWVPAAGVPDPRGMPGMPNLPLVPEQCAYSFSQMFWDLGFRHHSELQTKWVIPGNVMTPGRLTARKPKQEKQARKKGKKGKKVQELAPGTGITPEEAAEMLAEIDPEKYAEVLEAKHGPKKHRQGVQERMRATAADLLARRAKDIRVPDNLMDENASGNT